MSKLKDVGVNVATLGIAWLLKKYVAKKLPKALVEVLDLAAAGDTGKVPPRVLEALEVVKRAQFEAALAHLNEVAAQTAESSTRALEKNDKLLADARAAYERGKRK